MTQSDEYVPRPAGKDSGWIVALVLLLAVIFLILLGGVGYLFVARSSQMNMQRALQAERQAVEAQMRAREAEERARRAADDARAAAAKAQDEADSKAASRE
jgi:hypothetical protein